MYCPRCRYHLKGVRSGICPECGRGFDPDQRLTFDAAPNADTRRIGTLGLCVLCGWGVALLALWLMCPWGTELGDHPRAVVMIVGGCGTPAGLSAAFLALVAGATRRSSR